MLEIECKRAQNVRDSNEIILIIVIFAFLMP